MRAARRAAGTLLSVLAIGAAAPLAAQPPFGRHDGELCVAIGAAPASCGPAQIDLHPGMLRLRIDDIVYRLHLRDRDVEVVLMHGAMQVDDFTVPFDWAGDVLRFEDAPRAARYEVRFAAHGSSAKR